MRKLATIAAVILCAFSARAAVTTTGGAITTNGGYKIHTFNSSGSFIVAGGNVSVTVEILGGGGSGGVGSWNGSSFNAGGGGGGGGINFYIGQVNAGTTTVVIGAGGAGVGASGGTGGGNNGGNSSFGATIAYGGGAGGYGNQPGQAGGCGGGGGSINSSPGTGSQGDDGGDGYTDRMYSGGGGSDNNTGGSAWPGSYSGDGAATGYGYGGGGGGGGVVGGSASDGGAAGGSQNQSGSAATDNKGGGGGGCGYINSGSGYASGSGGSGRVVITITSSSPLPGKTSIPNPANGAVNVLTNAQFRWKAGSDATKYRVHLAYSNASLTYHGTATTTNYNPGALTHLTNYKWRVDSSNTIGVTTGDVWYFTTTNNTAKAPTTPTPATLAGNIPTNQTLRWVDPGAGSHAAASKWRVYFGESGSVSYVSTVTATNYAPAGMTYNQAYQWYIVASNAQGMATGATWSFTTTNPIPRAAINPSPAHNSMNNATNSTFSWTDGGSGANAATNYQVFFNGDSIGYVDEAAADPGALAEFTTYNWQIVSYNAWGSVTGALWSFSTIGEPGKRRVYGVERAWRPYGATSNQRIWGK